MVFGQWIHISYLKNQMRENSPRELERNLNLEATLAIAPSLVPPHPHRCVFPLLSALSTHCIRLPVSFCKALWESNPRFFYDCWLELSRGGGEEAIVWGRGALGCGWGLPWLLSSFFTSLHYDTGFSHSNQICDNWRWCISCQSDVRWVSK